MTPPTDIGTRLELGIEGILLILLGVWTFRNAKRIRDWRLRRLGSRKDIFAEMWRDLMDGNRIIYSWRASSIGAIIMGLILILVSIFGKETIR
jgi:hypothetical protein